MKLTGDLEKKVNAAADQEEAKELIEEAGMLLTDDELAQVAGGAGHEYAEPTYVDLNSECTNGKKHIWQDHQNVFKHFNIKPISHTKICSNCGCVTRWL